MPNQSANPSPRCASVQAEARLIERIGKGCTQSFEELYRRYSGPLYSYAYQSLSSRQDAEESLQDTFVRIWEIASQYQEKRAHPFTWAMIILRGTCVDLLRKRNAKRRAKSVELRAVDEPTIDPEQTFASLHLAETTEQVSRALATLPEADRRCLELAVFGQISQQKISYQLNLPLGTVKTRIRRSLSKIRNLLKSHDA